MSSTPSRMHAPPAMACRPRCSPRNTAPSTAARCCHTRRLRATEELGCGSGGDFFLRAQESFSPWRRSGASSLVGGREGMSSWASLAQDAAAILTCYELLEEEMRPILKVAAARPQSAKCSAAADEHLKGPPASPRSSQCGQIVHRTVQRDQVLGGSRWPRPRAGTATGPRLLRLSFSYN